MKKNIEVVPSGNPLVDLSWGGFYRGGTYFLLGPRKSGRTVLALQYAQKAVIENETCLFFTSFRPRDLMINAAAINVDLQHCILQNLIILVRVTPAKNVESAQDPDSYLKEYIRDIKSLVDQYSPGRIVFDELTPFVGFKDLNLLKETFLETIDYIEEKSITSLFILGEPVTPAAQKITSTLLDLSTGYISLEKEEGFVNKSNPGLMKITPYVGHFEGQFHSKYFIEPYKGIEIDFQPSIISSNSVLSNNYKKQYTPLTEIEIPQRSFTPASIYPTDDFKLLLNNQIAYFKTTGQISTLVSVKLGEIAEKNGLLTINQLANAIRLSVDKKDKICIIGNKVLILFSKEDRDVRSLTSLIVSNLPNNKPQFLDKITPFIFLYSVKVDKNTQSAEDMFKELYVADIPDKDKFGLN